MKERRKDPRMALQEVPALIIDRERLDHINATIRDFSKTGCQILTKEARSLPQEVGLHIEGIEELILGEIVWRTEDVAGVEFRWKESTSSDKRREERFKVSIPVAISNRDGSELVRCTVNEASKSGCRIEVGNIDNLDDDIHVQMRKMDFPIDGRIMWRGDKCAGVKLFWKVAKKAPDAPKIPRARVSA